MKLYTKEEKITTWLYFYMHNAQGNEFLDYKLPYPNYLLHRGENIFIAWLINGYPGTQEARNYFNDIIARFIITFSEYKPEKLDYSPKKHEDALIDLRQSYELKQFQNLQSITTYNKEFWTTDSIATIDQTFWAIKLYTEDLIRHFGEGTGVPYELLEDFALRNFYDRKDRSTLRAKCRNIWNWYNKRNWTIPKRTKESKMTRSERAKENAKNIKARKRKQILNAITGIFANEYKKQDGTWNIYKLKKDLGMSDNTIRKHLREMREEGII
jgi:hypothetical protein